MTHRQPTWDRLIRLRLAFEGSDRISREAITQFRRENWARSGSDNCLAEFQPLPAPTRNCWPPYMKWTGDAVFESRKTVISQFGAARTRTLGELIRSRDSDRQRVIVFYGTSLAKRWTEVVKLCTGDTGFRWKNIETSKVADVKVHCDKDHFFVFALVPHPAARGVRDEDFEAIGRELRSKAARA